MERTRLSPGKPGAPCKGDGPQRELDPPGNWFVPPGSNQSSGGGNETVEASGAEGRLSDSVSRQAVTWVNAESRWDKRGSGGTSYEVGETI